MVSVLSATYYSYIRICIFISVLCVISVMTANVNDVARLHSHLFGNYNKVIPPVYNQSHPVFVKLSLFLLMIMDLVSNSIDVTVCFV